MFGNGLEGQVNDGIAHLKLAIREGDYCVDVIGFSRGAIAAVEFCRKIEKLKNDPEISKIEKVRFLGLFDPVSGPIPIGERTIPAIVEKTMIIYAKNEKRNFFSPVFYTGENIKQISMKGWHSDIGGDDYDKRGLSNDAYTVMIFAGMKAGASFIPPHKALDKFLENDAKKKKTFNKSKKHKKNTFWGGGTDKRELPNIPYIKPKELQKYLIDFNW